MTASGSLRHLLGFQSGLLSVHLRNRSNLQLYKQNYSKAVRPLFNMAWRSTGNSNSDLITNLTKNGLITTETVGKAMLRVDRAHYAPSKPYNDAPQYIGHDATISAPHMHANAVESLLDYIAATPSNPAPKVLDVGSGSGYLTHVIAELVGTQGQVIGIDHIQPLVDLAKSNMSKSAEGKELLKSGRVQFVCGDGRKGWPKDALYDAIHVGAAAREAHEELLQQLKSPGRLFIPVGESGGTQYIWVIDKDKDGKINRKREYGVRYVPLTDAPGQ